MIPLLLYIGFFILTFAIVRALTGSMRKDDFIARKTVTFGDESAVVADRRASFFSIFAIFLLWASFTGSVLLPDFLHMPGPFTGTGTFTYTAQTADGQSDDATVSVTVLADAQESDAVEVAPGEGFAKNDSMAISTYRSSLARVDANDEVTRDDGATVVAVNGEPIAPGGEVRTDFARIGMSQRGTLNVEPNSGWQMEPIWLPAPEAVFKRFVEIASTGFRNYTLLEHLGFSLFRVVSGFVLGAVVGIPLGYAMGLSNWFRGWFDPIVEFMRPVPPLALIPLVIIWAGIGEGGKIILLFLAALWIMAIAARAGVSGVDIAKVHAAYSLGASKAQIMRHVIVPNSLPEIFTGARVAMGVCWGTVVAAELVAAEKGAGMMIMVASKFQNTDIVLMGIILIGIIGFGIDILMRWCERVLVPWKGRS
ncbi:ABC transporter permease subunit [Pseudooceanicola sediminis]|uniref:ABC transporter permease subunit n=1 Tax=Pseudooceanicola sediminis TaxID=2211117 RepID=A0A399J450_9RHOB|nr:ABC transporter permease subunit [Pseudooceanicola sediminis]KAA2315618.1 ABC transporter permease subunit [Puniceibacterium sp. HSS470]RII40183.1 ABC transporter permease subunit [Pseudooceanicola sediminis]|tara:strand:+ start:119123 stop:120391 length:1269 start_codon:yes stop_codon:yes gene_type:complete